MIRIRSLSRKMFESLTILSLGLLACACHETIHIHPWESDETVRLTLHINNEAPQLGAIIDYTISPPVIVFSDRISEKAQKRSDDKLRPDTPGDESLIQRARSLADAFDVLAPYELDGENWEMHLKYEIYQGTFDDVRAGKLPVYTNDITYRADEKQPIHDVDIDIPFGPVTVIAVGHHVPYGWNDDYFFATAPLHTLVSVIEKRNGEDDNVYRDCFAVAQEFFTEPVGIDGYVHHLTATLTRPQGRYMVLADDYEDYLKISNISLDRTKGSLFYPTYINTAYSLMSNMPIASGFNFGYQSDLSVTQADGKPYVRIGDDWSFVNGDRSNFNIDISVLHREDAYMISHNPGVLVPIFPNMVTLVVGHWLTEQAEGGGGVMVDPDFTDEIVLHF